MFTQLVLRFEASLTYADKSAPVISDRGVDWHLEHCLKIVVAISDTLEQSNPNEYRPKFSFWKSIILWTGYMPRGRAKSPKPFNNLEKVNIAQLPELLTKAKLALAKLDSLPANSFFKHPMFGHLNLSETKRFIFIHSNHHLKIVDEITHIL